MTQVWTLLKVDQTKSNKVDKKVKSHIKSLKWESPGLKRGFHGPTNHADEGHRTVDLLDLYKKIFSLCHRFVESVGQNS